ncbi:ATP-binding protein [Levilinea saccharolytica]|uniref:ATP-binding protein n=1 Tax=Levilinea saccharolytica TaxID=229921 RepID=UPI00094679E1
MDEACSNIIEHGYQGQETGEIRCTTLTDAKGLTIILEDRGQPKHQYQPTHEPFLQCSAPHAPPSRPSAGGGR